MKQQLEEKGVIKPNETIENLGGYPCQGGECYREKKKGTQAVDGFVLKCCSSQKNYNQFGVVGEKAFMNTYTMGLDQVLSDLEVKLTNKGVDCYQLCRSGCHIKDTGHLLPTPAASNHKPIRPLAPSEAKETHRVWCCPSPPTVSPSYWQIHQSQLLEWMMGFPMGEAEVWRQVTPLCHNKYQS
ncbi:hypothetical protein [Bacillus altitudinis]